MKVTTLWVGKDRVKWADQACQEYTRRLPRHLSYAEKRIAPVVFRGDEDAVRVAEAELILGQLSGGDRLVCLDERGDALDSHGFAKLFESAAQQGAKRVVFAIGGPYGHGPKVRDQAWKTVRLSSMVLNHAIARVVLSEQLYRASTLLWGGSYHH